MVHCKYINQKTNKKSFTKAEVVGVRDYLPYKICIYLFMGAKVYDIKKNILLQDNHSAINMEKNGKKSCNGKYRHIDIRF